MCEDGGLIDYGMAPAVYVVPVVERSHARLPAVLWARSCLRPGALIAPEITLDRESAAARPRRGSRCGSVQAGGVTHAGPYDSGTVGSPFIACVVRT
jgi:hypothetical protein